MVIMAASQFECFLNVKVTLSEQAFIFEDIEKVSAWSLPSRLTGHCVVAGSTLVQHIPHPL